MNTLFSEFKRRNVFRVAALYLVSAWLIAQVADVVIGLGELPPSIGRVVLIILALGFPVMVALAWIFEWTPQGIRLESEAAVAEPARQPADRRLDYMIMAMLSVALVYFIATHDWRGPPQISNASVAVLPFENRSAQPDDLYFTDGIHEDILTQLGKISSMVVISRTSVMQYRESVKTIPEIAKELGVATILEGGVQRAGSRVRINMQLIEAASDRHLWAETWDRELTADNVFAIQSEIASSIARALHARLLPQELTRIETVPTHDFAAYDAYLVGRQFLASRYEEDLYKARGSFLQAIGIDQEFALAYTGLSNATALLAEFVGDDRRETLLVESEEAAQKALELDPELGEAHTALGVVKRFRGDPLDQYAHHLARGVELSPGSADARKWYSNYLADAGQDNQALEQLETAVRLDPLSPIIRVNLAGALTALGRREEGEAQVLRALDIDPQFRAALASLWDFRDIELALKYVSRGYQRRSFEPWILVDFVLSYINLGDDVRAEEWAVELERVAPESVPTKIARLNLALYRSDDEASREWAERLYRLERGISVPTRTLLLHDLRTGDLEAAQKRYQEKYPELLMPDPTIGENYGAATDVAILLRALGDTDRADSLLERCLEYLAGLPEVELPYHGVFIARIQALQGKKDESLATLRRTIDAGWIRHWWFYLKMDPAFDGVRDDARFKAMVEELDADMARRLAKVRQYEANGEITMPPGS